MNRDRRKTYRVALRPCEHLLITVHREHGLPLLGDVVALATQGAGARFSLRPPPLTLGESLRISLSTRGGPRPIELLATVASRSDEPDARHYELEFLDSLELRQGLVRRLFRLFNRRGQLRVRMDDAPAAVRSGGAQQAGPFRAQLRDLSSRGLALVVPAEAEEHLRHATHLEVRFRLPGDDAPLQVAGIVRSRQAVPAGLVLGLLLDADGTRRFPAIEERIRCFLRQREAEELLGAAAPPGETRAA